MPELLFAVTEADHVIGAAEAAVTLVEYGDYQCPHCQAAHPVVAALLRRFGDDLRLAYRHFPLTAIHPMAQPAAETAEFAGSQGRFWDMHDALFANSDRLSAPTLFLLADRLGLDSGALREALADGSFSAKVDKDLVGGMRSGVQGTPTFFINGQWHHGGYDPVSLGGAIGAALREAADLAGAAR